MFSYKGSLFYRAYRLVTITNVFSCKKQLSERPCPSFRPSVPPSVRQAFLKNRISNLFPQVLMSESGFEFRVVEETPKFPRANVNLDFLRIVDQVMKEEEEEEEARKQTSGNP